MFMIIPTDILEWKVHVALWDFKKIAGFAFVRDLLNYSENYMIDGLVYAV